MALALSPHVHAAVIGGDLVLLDVLGDAYLCVPDGVRDLRPGPDLRTLAPCDAGVAGPLREAGLTSDVPSPAPTPPVATQALDAAGDALFGPGDGRRLAGALWDFTTRYRGRSFAQILVFAGRASPPADDNEEALRLARLFRRAVVWLPLPGQCLARSFVLLRFLQRSGCRATWVFGVQTWPFSAHCWLQAGDVVLDDAPERVIQYEPILAVGVR